MPQPVITTDDMLQVYQDRDLDSTVIAHLAKGVEIQLDAATVHEGRQWMAATLEDGSVGYVLGPSAHGHTTLGESQLVTKPPGGPLVAKPSDGPCPNCKLISPAGTRRCECGYDFASGRVEDAVAAKAAAARAAAAKTKRLNLTLAGICFLVFMMGSMMKAVAPETTPPRMPGLAEVIRGAITLASLLFAILFLVFGLRSHE